MKIAIGTLNKAKNAAVQNVIKTVWNDVEFISIETDSGISNQPLNDEESIKGAINRARQALAHDNADYGIGLEGGVHTIENHGMFLHGWIAIVDNDGNIGLGRSGSIELPKHIELRINNGEELGPIMQELMKDDKNTIRHSDGTNGILTNGLYTRVKEFEDATRCALAKFVSRDWYK
jgi:inosine/xanthosine triphosphatase